MLNYIYLYISKKSGGTMNYVFNFLMMFVLINLFYFLFIIKKALKDKKKQPVEIKYLINLYKLDINKLDYKKLLRLISLATSFVIALGLCLVSEQGNLVRQIILTVIIILPFMFITYHIIGKVYQKRMMKNNE